MVDADRPKARCAMPNATLSHSTLPLFLRPETAADLMSSNPVSLNAGATVPEALELLTARGFGAAPVIDEAGRPVGVLSRSDLLIHDREAVEYVPSGQAKSSPDLARVRDLMTPVIFTARPHTPASEVVGQMVQLKVHQLFVVDEGGALVGVISALDVLRHLAP
jgi:CBS domain-containing protein